MAQDFYPFVDNSSADGSSPESDDDQYLVELVVRHPARIAVYDDVAAAPRVVVVEPQEVRSYLEEITLQVTQLAQQQGGTIPFMVIREIVENLIHAYFIEPTVSILDNGNTIRFSDQGPGIGDKRRALQYGTTSATEEMRRYIRGVGSGLPYVQQYMRDKGGSLEIDDNISGGTVITLSTSPSAPSPAHDLPQAMPLQPVYQQEYMPQYAQQPWQQQVTQPVGQPYYAPQMPPQPPYGQQVPQYPQQFPQQMPQQPAWPSQPQQPAATGPQVPQGWAQITVRGRAIMDYLSNHESVGPSDLARTYGESQPTWTRELQTLEEQGLIRKDGQKRRLTGMGKSWLASGER